MCRLFDLLTDDGNGESLLYGASAADDLQFIKSESVVLVSVMVRDPV